MITRRALLGTGLVVAAGGIGAAVAGLQPRRRPPAPPAPPQQLSDALAREQSLVAGLDAALPTRPELQQVRDDHVAHAAALRQAVARYPAAASSPSSAGRRPAVDTTAQLRAAELTAAKAAAAESAALAGADAALLASISASEATHAELLT
jgi:hypothetical protein